LARNKEEDKLMSLDDNMLMNIEQDSISFNSKQEELESLALRVGPSKKHVKFVENFGSSESVVLDNFQCLETAMDLDKSSSKQLAALSHNFPTDEGLDDIYNLAGTELGNLDVSPIEMGTSKNFLGQSSKAQ